MNKPMPSDAQIWASINYEGRGDHFNFYTPDFFIDLSWHRSEEVVDILLCACKNGNKICVSTEDLEYLVD